MKWVFIAIAVAIFLDFVSLGNKYRHPTRILLAPGPLKG